MLRSGYILLAAVAAAFLLSGPATANDCRLLKQRMMMHQAAREMAQYHQVRGLLARNCTGSQQRRAMVARPGPARTQSAGPTRGKPRMSVAGTYRTWCVRSCDGYYFPVSFSTTRDRLEADQATCERACPGASPQLYYHRSRGETPEDMISIDGARYAALATAFQYRDALSPSCSCGRPHDWDVDPVEGPAHADGQQPGIVAAARLPRPRQAPGEDPETLANRVGDFDPRVVGSVALASDNERGGPVRVVWSDEPNPVVMSPVPNDFETSLLWTAQRAKARRAQVATQ